MTARLFTLNDLDTALNAEISIDCDKGSFPRAVLVGVYTNGNFEAVVLGEEKDTEVTFSLYDPSMKVFKNA